MANALITPTIIARVALAQLQNQLVMGRSVYRGYSSELENKIGDTVQVRRPVLFSATDGAVAVTQDVNEGQLPVQLNKRKHVSWKFDTRDLTLVVEQYNERYILPAMIALANQIDADGCAMYRNVWNWVGTPGTKITNYVGFSKGPERLDKMAVPSDQRTAVLSPADKWGLLGSQTSLFIQKPAEDAYRRGELGEIGGVDTAMDQNIVSHTTGGFGGTPLTNGASQNVTYAASANTQTQSFLTKGWTASTATVNAGDVFTLAGVSAVNPKSKVTTGELQQFVIQANATSDAGGLMTLSIAPPIITSGPYQTVTAAPADGAALTMVGTAATSYPQNMVFHKNAFALVMAPLAMPDGAVFKARESQNGFSVRVLKWWDGENDEERIRLDVLYGWKAVYPDLASRLSGT